MKITELDFNKHKYYKSSQWSDYLQPNSYIKAKMLFIDDWEPVPDEEMQMNREKWAKMFTGMGE